MKRILLSIMLGASIVSNVSPMKRKLVTNSEPSQKRQCTDQFSVLTSLVEQSPDMFTEVVVLLDGKSFSTLTQVCKSLEHGCNTFPVRRFQGITCPDAACHGNVNLTRRFLALPQDKFFDPTAAEPVLTGTAENGDVARLFRNDFGQAEIHPMIHTFMYCGNDLKNDHLYLGSVHEAKSSTGVLISLVTGALADASRRSKAINMENALLKSNPNFRQGPDFCLSNRLGHIKISNIHFESEDEIIEHCKNSDILLLFVCMHNAEERGFIVPIRTLHAENGNNAHFEYMCINVMLLNAALKNFVGVVEVLLNNKQALTCLSNEALEAALGITESDEIKQLVNSVIKARQA